MSGDFCRGCGSVIQTKDSRSPGYVPEEMLETGGRLICRRCYRMTHYGEAGSIQPALEQIRSSIRKAVGLSEFLVVVADFTDLTGTLPVWEGMLGGKPYFLVVNKLDLLPGRTDPGEIVEYLRIYLKTVPLTPPAGVFLVSGLKGKGVEVVGRQLKSKVASGWRIAFLGVTNVGKSSLIRKFLTNENSNSAPTVSKFPGTTLGLSNWSIFRGRNTLIDTPGLVTGNRLVDLLCPECVGRLFSTSKLEEKLWGLKPGKGLILGGLTGIEPLEKERESVMIVFTSPEFGSHRTDQSKIRGLMDESPAWLCKICKNCRSKIVWREETVLLKSNQDLAIAGLGWVSLRGQEGEYKLTLPEGVRWEVRPALVGKRM